ncbi:MAG TPA: hypothetical protein VNE41_00730 [Chitinophagaceae bacterium]|nr:hypothetical protein [Chitinophagaceae bacterium]
MKKLLISGLYCTAILYGSAQKKYINNAKDYMKSGDLDKAKNFIDQAVTDAKTSTDFDAWYVRGEVYREIGQSAKFKNLSPNPDSVALISYQESQKLKPSNPDLLINTQKIGALYSDFWKNAVTAFNNKDYSTAYIDFKSAVSINDFLHSMNTMFGADLDTMAVLNMSNAAYNEANANPSQMEYMDSAVAGYQKLADIKYKNTFVYQVLLNYYLKQMNTAKFMATADEAKLLFPDNADFGQQEMEYYRETGKMDEYLQQLKAGVEKDPNNYILNFNLGVTLDDMANPKDSIGNNLPKPANFADLFNQAVEAYKKAISIKPDEYGPNFNLGLMYFNRAAMSGKLLGSLGTSKADQMKSDSLTKKQNDDLALGYPYLEKTYEILDAKPKLNANELNVYQEAMTGLKEIYARKNETDKYNEIDQKLKNAGSKLGN